MERTEGIEPVSVCLEGSCAAIALSPLTWLAGLPIPTQLTV